MAGRLPYFGRLETLISNNKVADKLAKEAAVEAQELDNSTSVITNQDIKKAARDSILDKWQNNFYNRQRIPSVQIQDKSQTET